MSQAIPVGKDDYILEHRLNQEIDLENIDEELRMEHIRQLASKFEWANFGAAVRRNLLEKRNTIDAESRRDVLNGIAYMRTKMPIDESLPMEEKIRILGTSLDCQYSPISRGWALNRPEYVSMDFTINDGIVTTVVLSFWEEPSFYSPTATKMLQSGQWTEFRNDVAAIIAIYDKNICREDWLNCRGSMQMLQYVFSQYSMDPSYNSVNRSNFGHYLPGEDMRQGRVYYVVNPLYRHLRAKDGFHKMTETDYETLPYFKFEFDYHSSKCTIPQYNMQCNWENTVEVNASIVLKLSKPLLITKDCRLKLGAISAKAVKVKHYTNAYRFMAGETKIKNHYHMITQFGDKDVQHYYTIHKDCFDKEDDSVITAVYLKKMEDFPKAIEILRNEAMHLSLWESMLAMCYEKHGIEEKKVPAIKMNVNASRKEFEFSLKTKFAPIKIFIRESGPLECKVEVVHEETGKQIAERIDEILSRKLNESWNIPTTLTHAVQRGDCEFVNLIKVPLRAPVQPEE